VVTRTHPEYKGLQANGPRPVVLRFWSLGGEINSIRFSWRDQVEWVEHTLALGLNDTLAVEPPLGYVEECVPEGLEEVSSFTERLLPGKSERYLLLKKAGQTPAGPLQTVGELSSGVMFSC
jgi:hypothetical protein